MFFRTGGGRGAGVQPEQEGRGVEAKAIYLNNTVVTDIIIADHPPAFRTQATQYLSLH